MKDFSQPSRNKFQKGIKFRDMEELLNFLPENELAITGLLRSTILDSCPGIQEKLTYNVPFYYLKSRTFFIWPSSIPWGKVATNGVQLGFCQGHKIPDELRFLEAKERKEIRSRTFFSTKEVREKIDIIKAYLSLAQEINMNS